MTEGLEEKLVSAARKGDLAAVGGLLNRGVDVNARPHGKTPLQVCVRKGHSDVARFLLDKRADVDAEGDDKRTPLIEAIEKEHAEIVELLLEHGANPDKADSRLGATPLIYATLYQRADMVRLLLQFGADPEIPNHHGDTPKDLAQRWRFEDVVSALKTPKGERHRVVQPPPKAAEEHETPIEISETEEGPAWPEEMALGPEAHFEEKPREPVTQEAARPKKEAAKEECKRLAREEAKKAAGEEARRVARKEAAKIAREEVKKVVKAECTKPAKAEVDHEPCEEDTKEEPEKGNEEDATGKGGLLVSQRLEGIRKMLAQVPEACKPLGDEPAAVVKGNETERFLESFLSQVMPTPYRFGSGIAIDAAGKQSAQLDIVLEYPFAPSFPLPGVPSSRMYLAEGVAAVIEVKTEVGRDWPAFTRQAKALANLERTFDFQFIVGIPPTQRIPLFLVSYKGSDTDDFRNTARATVRNHPVDGILIMEPPLFVSKKEFGEIEQKEEKALWAFISSLHQAVSSLQSASIDPKNYAP